MIIHKILWELIKTENVYAIPLCNLKLTNFNINGNEHEFKPTQKTPME